MTGAAAPSVRAISCPSCGGSIALQAAGFSTSFICQYCGSELDLVDPEIRLVREHAEAGEALWIPIGSRGRIGGVEYAVTGYIRRGDGYESWNEYLLFNPYHGYRWLTHAAAGWSFGTPLMTQPGSPAQDRIELDGHGMKQCFYPAEYRVIYALGEFYWKVQKGDVSTLVEYVGGGRMLSCEISGDEHNWTLEEWISSADVAAAFGVNDSGQYPVVGEYPQPHQPNPHTPMLKFMGSIASLALLAAILFVTVLEAASPRATASIAAMATPDTRTAQLGPFTISGRPRPFVITTRGEPGDNNWIDVGYTLTNTATGEEIIANQPIEYYYGHDWKEDGRRGTIKLSAVPPGSYTLEAEVSRPEDEYSPAMLERSRDVFGNLVVPTRQVEISAGPGGIFWSNLFLLFLAMFAPVGWVLARSMSFEAARQEDYDGEDDDDDDD